MRLLAAVVAMLLLAPGAAAQTPTAETIREVRVHGNHTTPDAEVLGIAGVAAGTLWTEQAVRDAEERLRRSGRFADVELRKRYRSIDDPNDILLIVLVDERAGISEDSLLPGPFKRFRSAGMWLPVLDYADGYGFTYGARVSFVGAFGRRSRISMPFTWGGERKAAIEAERTFERGPFSRIAASASIARRENPFFEVNDTRREVRGRAERAVTSWLRVGGGARLTAVDFGGREETFVAPGIDVLVDTRTDPVFPRNAVHVTAGLEQLRFDGSVNVTRWTSDVRGYVGLVGSSVLALRSVSVRASDALPPYEQALLGGTPTLRGYDFAYRAGDNLAAFTAELRVPMTSPMLMSRFGVKGFVDAGTVYPSGSALADQRFDRGVGGGVFITWAVLNAGLDVAWPVGTQSRKPRWHFGLGVTF